jgi:tetratricopeptide (TPR) repeat protein
MATRARQLAEQLGDTRATAWAEWALAVVHGNDGLPRGAGVTVDDAETAGHMQRAVELWAEQPGPSWWDPVWERGLQQLCCSIFLPYGPSRLSEFNASRAAFESIGDRGWLAILFAQALDHLEFAGAEVTKAILEEGANLAISPSWSYSCRYRLGALHLLLGELEPAIEHLTAALEYGRAAGEGNWSTEARLLAVAYTEVGEIDRASELLESVFVAVQDGRGEREVMRTLTAAAYVLERRGQRTLAARALGRARPFQDNWVDAAGIAHARLSDSLGERTAQELMDDGAQSDVSDLVTEVRSALACS